MMHPAVGLVLTPFSEGMHHQVLLFNGKPHASHYNKPDVNACTLLGLW